MDERAFQLSRSIDGVSRTLAEWTVSRHAERDPTLPDRYGQRWRRRWVRDVEQRVRLLAQSVAIRRPQLFADEVAWTGVAFETRQMDSTDVRASLHSLREVVSTELPNDSAVLLEHVDAALGRLDRPVPGAGAASAAAAIDGLTLEYLEAVLSGRRDDAVGLLTAASAEGRSITSLYQEVLQPALVEVGRMWHADEIGIADEHFATATTELAMSMLRSEAPRAPRRDRRVVATSVAGDLHSIGVRMVAELFEMDGWDAIYLGPNMPGDEILRCVAEQRAHLLAVSATSTLSLRTLGELIADLKAEPEIDVPVLVGGGPLNRYPGLWKELGADGWAGTAAEALSVAGRLVDRP